MNGNKDAQMDITWPGMSAPKKLKSMCTCVSGSVWSKSQLGLHDLQVLLISAVT